MEKQLSIFQGDVCEMPIVGEYSKQNDRVLAIFKLKQKPLTPTEVHMIYLKTYCNCPLQSMRRALSDLTRDGKLVKTNKTKITFWKHLEYYWKLNK